MRRCKALELNEKKRSTELQKAESIKVEVGTKVREMAKWLPQILAWLPICYAILKYMYDFRYGQQCKAFYHIPAKYFSKSVNSSILYIALIVFLVVIPFLLKWCITKVGGEKSAVVCSDSFALFVGVGLGSFNIQGLTRKIESDNFFLWHSIGRLASKNMGLYLAVIMVCAIITMIGLLRVSYTKKVKNKMRFSIFGVILAVSFVITMVAFIGSTAYALCFDPANKTAYEIADYEKGKYAVLSEYNGKLLVVPAAIKGDELVLDTTWYFFVDSSECKFFAMDFEKVTQIEYAGESATGSHRNISFFLSPMCNTSLTYLQLYLLETNIRLAFTGRMCYYN